MNVRKPPPHPISSPNNLFLIPKLGNIFQIFYNFYINVEPDDEYIEKEFFRSLNRLLICLHRTYERICANQKTRK